MMDLKALLQSHGETAPSGEDPEYDADFQELEIAAQPKEEQQIGDEIRPGEEPDYRDVAERAEAILQRAHDLRAAIYLGEAQLRLNGLPGFAEATSYLRGCIEQYWDTCHPQLDEEDDNDPTMRRNALIALTDGPRIIRAVRRAPLTRSGVFGGISLRDIAVAEGAATPSPDMDDIPDQNQVQAAFKDTSEEDLAEIRAAASQALEDVEEIVRIFDEKTGGDGPSLDPLIDILKQAKARLTGSSEESVAATDVAAPGAESAPVPPGSAAAVSAGGAVGGIRSPTDVQNALDRIITYYETYEPSSPLPLLLLRAKRLVSADFLTIMKDMAPSGIENVNLIGGIEDEDD